MQLPTKTVARQRMALLTAGHAPALQMDGMQAGYNVRVEHERQLAEQQPAAQAGTAGSARLPRLGRRDFLFMSAVGDYDPLQEALGSRDHGAAGGAEGCWCRPHSQRRPC